MARQPGKGRGKAPKQRPSTVEEGVAWLRSYAIQMFDREEGREADWPVIAQTMFAAAFSVIDEAKGQNGGDERARKVLRRVEAGLYNRLALNPDDELPPVLGMGEQPARTPLPAPPSPEPRHRP